MHKPAQVGKIYILNKLINFVCELTEEEVWSILTVLNNLI